MGKILVTGGAGYIGSAAVKALINAGSEVLVVDNLSKGKKELVDPRAQLFVIDLVNKNELAKVFEQEIDVVIHFASYKAVGESMEDAVKYSDNLTGSINLLNLMVEHDVKRMVYSSSAAVYGMPDVDKVTEETPTNPISFYGYTKLAMEEILGWYKEIHKIDFVALRYFNVAGDAGMKYIDPEAQNVFPIIMEVITGTRDKFTIFGTDYPTEDGTCVRDYIDINDLVDAHVKAVDVGSGIINLGTENGVSVRKLVEITKEVTSHDFEVVDGARRAGDTARLVASNQKARELLGWHPKKSVHEMVKSTFQAYIK